MTPDDPAIRDRSIPVCPFAAQIEEGRARFRARYLLWKQQNALAEDRQTEEKELPREG